MKEKIRELLEAALPLCALIAMTANFGEPGRSVGGFESFAAWGLV